MVYHANAVYHINCKDSVVKKAGDVFLRFTDGKFHCFSDSFVALLQ